MGSDAVIMMSEDDSVGGREARHHDGKGERSSRADNFDCNRTPNALPTCRLVLQHKFTQHRSWREQGCLLALRRVQAGERELLQPQHRLSALRAHLR